MKINLRRRIAAAERWHETDHFDAYDTDPGWRDCAHCKPATGRRPNPYYRAAVLAKMLLEP